MNTLASDFKNNFSLFKNQYLTVKYIVTAVCDPASLPRILELFTLRGITPDYVKSQKSKEGLLVINIQINMLNESSAQVILEKIHALILVRYVNTEIFISKNLNAA